MSMCYKTLTGNAPRAVAIISHYKPFGITIDVKS